MIMVFLQRIWHMTQKHILDRHKQILLNQYFVPKWWEINDILFLLLKEMIETSLKASWIQQLSINKSNKKYRIFYKYFFFIKFHGFYGASALYVISIELRLSNQCWNYNRLNSKLRNGQCSNSMQTHWNSLVLDTAKEEDDSYHVLLPSSLNSLLKH